ncbi:hypothetical protein [Halorussus halophilus]|uniref:hypothetical protein n=1 Tax=Halorussus halophilus TaxID=2650975 RepID=UPI00130192A7|nr:hypothetical protein [Halorussus halophilus]
MVSGRIVVFSTDGFDADERLVREYVVPEFDRLTGIEDCEGIAFSRATTDRHADRGGVHLTIFGDHESVVETERDRWNEFVADDLVEEWSVFRPEWEQWPEEQARLTRRFQTLASEMACSYFREFDADERPAPADQFHDDERPLGFWLVSHFLYNQAGYGSHGELDGSYRSIENQLRTLVELGGAENALEKVQLLQGRLRAIEEELAAVVEPEREEASESDSDSLADEENSSTSGEADGSESSSEMSPAEVAEADPREAADVDPEELVEMDPEEILQQNLGDDAPSPPDLDADDES